MRRLEEPDRPVNPFIILIAVPIAIICIILMYLTNLKFYGTRLKKDKSND